MKRDIELPALAHFLKEMTEKYETRPCTLRILEGTIPMTEAEGLPLVGLDLESHLGSEADVEIVLGDEADRGGRYLSHRVPRVRRVTVESEVGNREKRFVFESGSGALSILTLD
jgi:hypothetical protein